MGGTCRDVPATPLGDSNQRRPCPVAQQLRCRRVASTLRMCPGAVAPAAVGCTGCPCNTKDIKETSTNGEREEDGGLGDSGTVGNEFSSFTMFLYSF